jgi:hypothetical protein
MEKTDIKEWYLNTFPTDELGSEMKDDITFIGLFEALDSYKCVYDFLGVDDSIVRERVFEKLSEVMSVSYDYIYDQWLKG